VRKASAPLADDGSRPAIATAALTPSNGNTPMKKFRLPTHRALRIAISLSIMALLLLNVLEVLDLSFVQRLENYAYDLRLEWTMPNTLDRRIVVVDVDEKSLQEQGHWPWPRNKLARMMDQLFDHYQIDVLGFDILFAERDESSGLKRLEQLAGGELRGNREFKTALDALKPSLDYDLLFANSVKHRRIALGYYFHYERQASGGVGRLPAPAQEKELVDPLRVGARVASGYSANLPELQANAATGGYFNVTPLVDPDGVLRRVPLLEMYDGALYEALGLAVARLALREPETRLAYAKDDKTSLGLEKLVLGKHRIHVDSDVAALVPYRGRQGSFPYVSASDVLQGKVPPDILKGAIVLVGTTAPGLQDLRTTPMQEGYPGVEAHANVIAGILDDDLKRRPAWTLEGEVALLLVVGLLLALALPALSPLWATLLFFATLATLALGDLTLWKVNNLAFPLASALLLSAAIFVVNMTYALFVESRGKRLITGLFGQYVPPELVDEMAKDPGAFTLSGESRELTVLFSDVRGFTTISEGLDPQQLTQLMNEYLTPMTHVIHKHRGTIDKYMGDAIMAFWGAPLHDPLHARHALTAAMDMLVSLEALQEPFKARGWPPIAIGVGLNSGDMTVGNMGSEFRLAYTVMGDAVNLGSRLESLTKDYGVQIIVSEFTRAAVPDFVYRELDFVRVKGKDRPVGIYQPICELGQASAAMQEELTLYASALACYRAQDWDGATEQFARLQGHYPERYLYPLYLKRLSHLRAHPPGADWDGSFTFTTK
jgi:adenylate cyclase